MASAAAKQLINPQTVHSNKSLISAHYQNSSSQSFISELNGNHNYHSSKLCFANHRNLTVALKSSTGKEGAFSVDDEEGVSLGTMKLPPNTDIPRFEILLFQQWANSLSQGAQLPLPVPLKVDKIEGGVRLGFVDIEDGKTQVRVYIDCQVISNNDNSEPPVFIATRNGALKK
ncbi:Membrane-associated 30 kDa protein chloroplastic [Bienertia sinuspersici]